MPATDDSGVYEISSRICGQSNSESISGQRFGFWIADNSPAGSGVVSAMGIFQQLTAPQGAKEQRNKAN
jgi:hypothetical protein